MKRDITADMSGFEIRDALRADTRGRKAQVVHFNFDIDDPGEIPVVLIAASGDVAKVLRQVMNALSGEGEYDLSLVPREPLVCHGCAKAITGARWKQNQENGPTLYWHYNCMRRDLKVKRAETSR